MSDLAVAQDVPIAPPVTRCGACGASDDHPKHQIAVGFNNPDTKDQLFHPHDHAREGQIYYHFDCPSEWHDLHVKLAVDPFEDPEVDWRSWTQESADAHRLQADRHARVIEWAKSGLHGDELRQRIASLDVRGGAGGIDQTMANAVLDALGPNSGTTTVGTKTITGPLHLRVMTANGSDTAAGTEQGTSAGYTAGGASLAFASAASGSKATNAPVSWTNFPACTSTGIEEWDTSGTPQRTFWGPWAGGNITIGAGNTFTVASSALSNGLL